VSPRETREPAQVLRQVTAAARTIETLTEDECRTVLGRQRLCVVSVVDGDSPYAVPVFYGYDGSTLYLGTSEGRKTRALDANSRVYVLVTEVGPGDAWRSVAVAGHARTLTSDAERQQAIDILIAHNQRVRNSADLPSSRPRRPSGGRLLRIDDPTVTGRSFGWPTETARTVADG
jgi:nitroimidazol reductase NimA-like FMN-containing flavoprotein (pyridoxamine 5'-phosphate oxidase superfamily)